MTRHLLHRPTGELRPYPRQDDRPVAGLDRAVYHVLQGVNEPQPLYDPATQLIVAADPVIAITDPNGEDVNGTVTYGWRVEPLPTPDPVADWIAFDIAIQSEPEIVATINDLGRLSQVATLSLGPALEEAEKGNLDRFLPIWQEWIIAANPPAAALERFRALAAQHHLPAEFQAAIAAPPAGPAVAP